jgi:hypothetical protein
MALAPSQQAEAHCTQDTMPLTGMLAQVKSTMVRPTCTETHSVKARYAAPACPGWYTSVVPITHTACHTMDETPLLLHNM